MQTTIGQLIVNKGLPEKYQDFNRVLDKKGTRQLLEQVAREDPEEYSKVLKHLMDVGRSAASTKGLSVNLRSLLQTPTRRKEIEKIRLSNEAIINDDTIDDDEREKRLITNTYKHYDPLLKKLMDEGLASGSPYAQQVQSGSRGKPGQYMSLVGADLLVSDYEQNPIPMPVYSSYSHGLDPAEYWAAAYGARKGLVDVKTGTASAGFLNKQMALAAHRQVVSSDRPRATRLPVGLVVDSDDDENIGSVLARDTGPYKAGTMITPKIQEALRRREGRILVHSPLTSLSEDGGMDRWSAGEMDGRLAALGTQVGISRVEAVGERLSQGTLDSKHRSGVGGEKVSRSGFEYINRLLQAPEQFEGAGPLAPVTGRILNIEKAPQGGNYVHIGDKKIYLSASVNPVVKPGQKVERGDDLSDGVPHPREMVEHLGIGEARRRYLATLQEAFSNSGLSTRRRNLESLVAGVINHVKIQDVDGVGEHLVDDIVPYQDLASRYAPRDGAQVLGLKQAQGQYLEEPALHYTPGTQVTKSMVNDLAEFGVSDLNVHPEKPGFKAHFERLMQSTAHDPDWQTQLAGFGIKSRFLKAVGRGAESDTNSTSYVPALAQGDTFGKELTTSGKY